MTTATKQPGWPQRLRRYIACQADQPYRLGTMDCSLFAAGAVDAMADAPVCLPYFAKHYTSALGARRVLREQGWQTLLDAAVTLIGPPAATGRFGDLTWEPNTTDGFQGLGALGVLDETGHVLTVGTVGLLRRASRDRPGLVYVPVPEAG